MWFLNRSDTNRPIQSQKMARGWKFWIKKVEELYYSCCENKDADQLRGKISFAVTAKLICVFVFAYVDCLFSHEAAQVKILSIELHLFDSNFLKSLDRKV